MRQPGAYHHARFMGKSLYILKIYLLSEVFHLTRVEKRRVDRLAQFVVLLYGKYFLSTSLSTAAPRHDLNFWYDLQEYRQFDRVAADQALLSSRRHLWYLTPELIALSLFDDGVTVVEKKAMAETLLQFPKPDVFAPGKPGQPQFNPVAIHLTNEKPPLASFITERSWLMFHLINADSEWLNDDPSTWLHNAAYRTSTCSHFGKTFR